MTDKETLERNPYRAPIAAVRDPEAPMSYPPQVALALWLFWAVFVVSLVSLHPAIRGEWWTMAAAEADVDADFADLAEAFVVLGVVMTVVFSALYAGLVVLIGRRHSWARWAMLGFALFGTAMTALEFPQSLAETPIAAGLDVVMTLAESWALYLVFFGPGAAWYHDRGRP